MACFDLYGDVLAAACVGADARETVLVRGAAFPERVISGMASNPAINEAVCFFIDVDLDATPV